MRGSPYDGRALNLHGSVRCLSVGLCSSLLLVCLFVFHVDPFQTPYVAEIDPPGLPKTVTRLTTEYGSLVYVVGTAHFSRESCEDVANVQLINNYQLMNCYNSLVNTYVDH